MKRNKRNTSSVKYVLQEQPRSPESGLIQVWLKQQQQETVVADLIGGFTFLAFQQANAGAATLTGTGLSLADLTEKVLILCSVGAIGAGSISCQMQTCSNSGGSGAANIGSAFGTVASTFSQFQLDMEAMTNTFLRSVVTITTGPTPICILGMAQNKLV